MSFAGGPQCAVELFTVMDLDQHCIPIARAGLSREPGAL
jgi:hypothetical protein